MREEEGRARGGESKGDGREGERGRKSESERERGMGG